MKNRPSPQPPPNPMHRTVFDPSLCRCQGQCSCRRWPGPKRKSTDCTSSLIKRLRRALLAKQAPVGIEAGHRGNSRRAAANNLAAAASASSCSSRHFFWAGSTVQQHMPPHQEKPTKASGIPAASSHGTYTTPKSQA